MVNTIFKLNRFSNNKVIIISFPWLLKVVRSSYFSGLVGKWN